VAASSSRLANSARFAADAQSAAPITFLRITPSGPMTNVSGTPVVWYARWIAPGASCRISNVSPSSRAKSRIASSVSGSSMLTATTARPLGPSSR
jgi:hypothetical protein